MAILRGFPPSNTIGCGYSLSEKDFAYPAPEPIGSIHIVREKASIEPIVMQRIKAWEEEQEFARRDS